MQMVGIKRRKETPKQTAIGGKRPASTVITDAQHHSGDVGTTGNEALSPQRGRCLQQGRLQISGLL